MLDTNPENLTGDEKILAEARHRFQICQAWERSARERFIEDYKFAHGDARNMYQWPDGVLRGRQGIGGIDDRPCLTINHVRQHNLQIINDAKQNKPSVKIRATGGKATAKAAEIYEGLVRHIEYISNAQVAYDTATEFQVTSGIGYWRILTDYANDDSHDQEIFIRRVKDPLTIYLDPDIREADGLDARYGFVFEDVPKDLFDRKYPEYKDRARSTIDGVSWVDENHVRVAEYFRAVKRKDTFFSVSHPDSGETVSGRASEMPDELFEAAKKEESFKSREIEDRVIEHYFIVGDEIAEKREWPGRYVPIVRLIGEETIIDNILDRKGHTRSMIDPQRQYNYWGSSAVEQVALQGKSPWVGPSAAFENFDPIWRTANISNRSFLPYNHRDDDGNEIPAPIRSDPPTMATAYVQGMQVAREDLMGSSGQYQAQLGQPSNERSGKAISERQRQGDNATYHYVDQQAISIRATGKILLDLIPKVYDAPRTIKILAENGDEIAVSIDPQQTAAYVQEKEREGEEIRHAFNPAVGKYEVEADIGPSYATQRQETWNALVQMATQSPELVKEVFGDLLFEAADFPKAEEIAERFKRLMNPAVLGEGLPPAIQQMLTEAQTKTQQLQGALQTTLNRLGEAQKKLTERDLTLKGKDQQKEIDVYDANTRRITAVSNAIELRATDPSELQALIHQMVGESLQAHLGLVSASTIPGLEGTAEQ